MAVRLSSRELFQWEVGGPSILGVPRGPSPATGPASLLGPVPSLMAVDVAHFSFLQECSLEAAPPRLRALPFLPRPAQPSVQCQSPLAYTGGGQRVEPRLQPPSPPSLLPSTFCPIVPVSAHMRALVYVGTPTRYYRERLGKKMVA